MRQKLLLPINRADENVNLNIKSIFVTSLPSVVKKIFYHFLEIKLSSLKLGTLNYPSKAAMHVILLSENIYQTCTREAYFIIIFVPLLSTTCRLIFYHRMSLLE